MPPRSRRASLARNRWQESLVQWVAALPSLMVVEADDGPVRPRQGGDDEAHPRKEFPEMMLDLRDHASRPVPGRHLILEAAVSDQRGMARSAAGPGEQILDAPLRVEDKERVIADGLEMPVVRRLLL